MKRVYIHEDSYGGKTWYTVMVDGEVYDVLHLRTGPSLTFRDQIDMGRYYQEALNVHFDNHGENSDPA